ncbi:hypothetical protein [Deinococcus soli (ex Cha et al. 2016)]|uniref:Adhesin domain-containing protein n=2 Tax=Deinococcus soli (ex Cha et al. 2016) TaxID=1309411 RepID=A0AAE3XF17_9DEIO|nr:hypothetical protein [Deinococcus soli (ex Cha et al. 2016)]MDR6219826.1 hypothetical protein [Deinococcus soli (ex Cha et al. 2016)]MDR6329916.1 hypothetical protein [Deinococcus soli (ex Cha et al. 2016)]MDR6752733.1 hypothetical protein [Deinococcus soli (ex Cha et al. 2016)]
MNDQHPASEFHAHVQRLVAEGKLTPEEARGLLDDTQDPPTTQTQPTSILAPGDHPTDAARDLHLLVRGYTLTVLTDAALSTPHLAANEDGRLSLEQTPQGWRVARIPGQPHTGSSLKAILTLPFTPGHTRAEISGGNLTLPDLAGGLRAEVNGGNVRMGRAHSLHADVNGGNLTGAQMSGPSTVTVNGGNLTLTGAATLNASVNGGNLTWAGTLSGGDHRVEVNAGNVKLHLQPGSSVHIDARVTLGSFKADFPTGKSGGFLNTHHTGQLGGGDARLHCQITAGNLKVVTA